MTRRPGSKRPPSSRAAPRSAHSRAARKEAAQRLAGAVALPENLTEGSDDDREAPAGLPTREAIVAFINSAPGKVAKRDIVRAFGISGDQRIWLKRLLKELEEDGLINRRHGALHDAAGLPPVVLADITGRDADGELIARPAEWNSDDEPPQIIINLPRRPAKGHQPTPGVGDRALLRVSRLPEPEGGPAYTGRPIKIIGRANPQTLGVFRALPEGGGWIEPVDKKSLGKEPLEIRPGDAGEAKDGDLVSVSVSKIGRFARPHARVRERLGSLSSEKAVSLLAIYAHGIPHVFSPAALAEADAARPPGMNGREDWRDLPLITIDPADARDHDDAVHAAADEDPNNPGGFVLTVAIADVAAYVRPGGELDRTARERGNSVYFPDRVVPMLPERISNDLCSLRPHEDRPSLAMRIVIDAHGRKLRHSAHRVMMRSAAKLAYQQAQAAIDGMPDDVTGPLLEPVLKPLWAAYGALAGARDRRSPLALDLPERKLLLDADGMLDRVIIPPRLDAHRLIEEFMILANVCAAETLERAGSPLLYRIHDEPSLEKMRGLGEVMASIGIKLPKTGNLRPELFNRILAQVEGTRHKTFINEVVLRSQAQAEYSADNCGHFGLNLRRYAHFTSPIRRYADLIVHRALIAVCKLGHDGLPAATTRSQLNEIAAQISVAERRAMAAERETIDRLIAHHLADAIGATFQGQISGVTRAGLFVRLADTGADGFVPAATIGDEFYRHDESLHALVGSRTGDTLRLGDQVEVRLAEAAPIAGALRFELMGRGGGRSRLASRKPGAKKDGKGKTGGKGPRGLKGRLAEQKKAKKAMLERSRAPRDR